MVILTYLIVLVLITESKNQFIYDWYYKTIVRSAKKKNKLEIYMNLSRNIKEIYEDVI